MPRAIATGNTVAASVALVAHRDGLTLGPSVGDTFALVEAKGASGAAIRGGQGARIDGNGYALAPRCRPIATTRSIPLASIPTPNCWKPSARSRPTPVPVRVTFRTLTGHPLLIQARREDGSVLPLGAVVVDDGGRPSAWSGRAARSMRARKTSGAGCWCNGERRARSVASCPTTAGVSRDQALIRLRGTCRAATTDSNLENAR